MFVSVGELLFKNGPVEAPSSSSHRCRESHQTPSTKHSTQPTYPSAHSVLWRLTFPSCKSDRIERAAATPGRRRCTRAQHTKFPPFAFPTVTTIRNAPSCAFAFVVCMQACLAYVSEVAPSVSLHATAFVCVCVFECACQCSRSERCVLQCFLV